MIKLIVSILLSHVVFTVQAQLIPGASAPEIALPDIKDSVTKLSSLSGKVVLIDFWASWCGPCRATNPKIRRLYKKYKDAGFEVFAVSIDDKKEEWLKAIKHDKLVYPQVIDTNGWYSKIIAEYFVDGIPMNFLLDKNGAIVAINLEGRKLEKKVINLLR